MRGWHDAAVSVRSSQSPISGRSEAVRARREQRAATSARSGHCTSTRSSMRIPVQDHVIGPDFHQVRQASHAQASGHFPRPLSTGGEETAERSTRDPFIHPDLPDRGNTPQPVKFPAGFAEIPRFSCGQSRPAQPQLVRQDRIVQRGQGACPFVRRALVSRRSVLA
jgi:hypothetical protein